MDVNMKTAIDMLYLSCCAITGEVPSTLRMQGLELEKIYALSRFHSVTALVCEGLELAKYIPDEKTKSIYSDFKNAKAMSVRRNLLLDSERAKIVGFLEKNKIWYMPLKGVILKDMYPKMGLRQMADNDILFDEDYRESVRDWFVDNEYEIDHYGVSNHDVYMKAPIYNYEMHISLCSDKHSKAQREYYKNIKSRLVGVNTSSCALMFTDEDFYIYYLTHAKGHFEGGGTGVRFLFDIYVYLKNKSDSMDMKYVKAELKKLGLSEFERDGRELAKAMLDDIHGFCDSSLTQRSREMLAFLLSSGTYGTYENLISRSVKTRGRLGYIICRVFPGRAVMKKYHPLFGHWLFLPFGWIYRAFVILFTRAGYALRELGKIIKTKRK